MVIDESTGTVPCWVLLVVATRKDQITDPVSRLVIAHVIGLQIELRDIQLAVSRLALHVTSYIHWD
jgi:hypothetical protein